MVDPFPRDKDVLAAMRIRLAVVSVLVVLATGCSGDDTTPSASKGTPTPVVTSAAPSPTASPSRAASPTASPSASPTRTTDFGFFVGIAHASAPLRLRFDRATFLTGDAANKAAAAHGDETPVPNDYYIVNDNPLVRVLELSPTVEVVGSIVLNGDAGHPGVEPAKRTVAELLHFLGEPSSKGVGFHLRLDAHGKVTRIEEQYVP